MIGEFLQLQRNLKSCKFLHAHVLMYIMESLRKRGNY